MAKKKTIAEVIPEVINITSEEDLLKYLKDHLIIDFDHEDEYYGAVSVIATVFLNGKQVIRDSSYVSGQTPWQSSSC